MVIVEGEGGSFGVNLERHVVTNGDFVDVTRAKCSSQMTLGRTCYDIIYDLCTMYVIRSKILDGKFQHNKSVQYIMHLQRHFQ